MPSDKIDQIGAALLLAQQQMKNAVLNKTNPHFGSRYADLTSVREAILGPLHDNGIVLLQTGEMCDGKPVLATTLIHAASGQWISGALPLPQTDKPQAFGSALTYLRRYGASAIAFITAEEDDDANAAEAAVKTPKPRFDTVSPPPSEYPQRTRDAQRPANDNTPQRFAPPVDPLLGIVAPHTIAVSKEERAKRPNLSYLRHWGGLFIAAIEQAKSKAEVDAWRAANDAALMEAENDSKLAARIADACAKVALLDQITAAPRAEKAGFLADLDAAMKTCRVRKTIDAVWGANAAALTALAALDYDAAMAVYQKHIDRVTADKAA